MQIWVLSLAVCIVANAESQCKWGTTFNNKPYVEDAKLDSFGSKGVVVKYLVVSEERFKIIETNSPPKETHGKAVELYTLFQDSALAQLENDPLQYVPIYITNIGVEPNGRTLRYLEPVPLDIVVRYFKVGTQDLHPVLIAGRIRKCLQEGDEKPEIVNLQQWVGRVIFELNDADKLRSMKKEDLGESASTILFIQIPSTSKGKPDIYRRFVARSVYPLIGENFVGDVVSDKVVFWLKYKTNSEFILYFEGKIDEVKRTITVVGNPKARGISAQTYAVTKLSKAPKFKEFRKNLKDCVMYGFCRYEEPAKDSLLRIAIENVTRIGGINGYFDDTEIWYSNVRQLFKEVP